MSRRTARRKRPRDTQWVDIPSGPRALVCALLGPWPARDLATARRAQRLLPELHTLVRLDSAWSDARALALELRSGPAPAELSVTWWPPAEVNWSELADSLGRLRSVSLEQPPCGVLQSTWLGLQEVHVGKGEALDEQDVVRLVRGLEASRALRKLTLWNCWLRESAGAALAKLLATCRTLEVLVVWVNALGASAQALVEAHALEELDLRMNEVRELRWPSQRPIRRLRLAHNPLGDSPAAFMAPGLEVLDVSLCGLGVGAAQALAELVRRGLRELDASSNPDMGEAAAAVALAQPKSRLRILNLSMCALGPSADAALGNVEGLDVLDVSANVGMVGAVGANVRVLRAANCGLAPKDLRRVRASEEVCLAANDLGCDVEAVCRARVVRVGGVGMGTARALLREAQNARMQVLDCEGVTETVAQVLLDGWCSLGRCKDQIIV